MVRKLTCVVAPAGFGKTTLVSEWAATLRKTGHPISWVSLEETDNDPAVFWQYVIASLEMANPDLGEHLTWLSRQDCEMPGTPSFIAMLNAINDFSEQMTLVLDDYHIITNDVIHEGIDYLLRHLPANLHLTLVSRSEPPLILSRLRAQNAVVNITQDDLKFTIAETQAFLLQIEGVELDSYQIGRLVSKTEGWIASLVLATPTIKMLTMRSDIDTFIEHFGGDHHYVLDFLTNEVLDQLDPKLRDFLLKTSLLYELNGPLCDAVLGTSDSASKLEILDRENTFIYPLNQQRTLYRYHTLFADMLQLKLTQSYPPAVINQLHLNACHWHNVHGHVRRAIPHALAVNDYALAADLIRSHLDCKIEIPNSELLQWLQRLPAHVMDQHPDLHLEAAYVTLVQGNLETAENHLSQLEQLLANEARLGDTVDVGELERGIAAIRGAIQCVTGDYQSGIALAQHTLNQLLDSDTLKGTLEYYMILAYQISGDLMFPIDNLISMIQDAFVSKDHLAYLFLQILLAMIYKERGQLHLAAQVYREAVDYSGAWSLDDHILTIVAKIGLSDIYREWDHLEKSNYYTAQIVEDFLQFESGEPCWFHSTNTCLEIARICLSQNDMPGAKKFIDIALDRAQQFYLIPELMHRVDALRLAYWLANGELRKASGWMRAKTIQSAQTPLHEKVLSARVLLAEGQPTQALNWLQTALPQLESNINSRALLEAGLLEALALWLLDQRDNSLDKMIATLAAAEPEGWVRTIVEIHPDIPQLLRATLNRLQTEDSESVSHPGVDYLEQLLTLFQGQDSVGQANDNTYNVVDLNVEALTERERVVLDLLAQGYSSGKIADLLTISRSTAKTHIRNIYQKLDAHSREYALTRARDLGLI